MKRMVALILLVGMALWHAANALGGESDSLYLVVDLSGGPDAESWPVSWMDTPPGSGWTDEYKSTKLLLRRIAPGAFVMGPKSEKYDGTYAYVYLSRPFYIGVFEVTQKQYSLVTGYNPSEYQGDTRPVECVSYDNIRGPTLGAGWPANRAVDDGSFLGLLRDKTQMEFDLPTEAQWEYACRAGTTTELNNGSNLESRDNDPIMAVMGRYSYNGSKHARVGLYRPNAWGLYDMHGNVQEYCLDWFVGYERNWLHPDVLNLMGPDSGTDRVRRGGSWRCRAADCTSGARGCAVPGTGSDDGGFRLAFTTDDSGVYTIRFNSNGGEGHDVYQRVPVGEPATLLPCRFSKAHHAFVGWATTPDGPVRYAEGESVSDLQPDDNAIATLYAVWELIVRFDANGGTGEMENQSFLYGVAMPLQTNAFEREHYAFSGWLCGETHFSDGQMVAAEDIPQSSGDVIMHAQWSRVEQVVTFDPNGGTCDTKNEIFTIGGLYSSLPHATMEHYALAGWYTATNGGAIVGETTTVTADDTRTLYARWTLVEQVATFDPSGGICPETNRTYTVGQPYAFLPTPTLEHYAAEWYTAPSGGNPVTPATIVPAVEYQTLHAHWTRADQIVTFDPNGGACDTKTQIQTIGQPYSNLPVATLEHYALAGWFTAPSGGDRVDGTIVPASDTLTLYAHWTRVDQIVTFDPNGGACDTETQIQTIGQPYTNLPAATLEHYALAGWFTERNGGDRVDGTTVTASETLTLYAHWTRVDQIVTFDPNGGTCGTETQIYTIGEPYASLPTATLEHYVLDGWYTRPTYGKRVDETTTVSATDTLTLYAHWRRVDQIVTFNPTYGICDTKTHIYTIGEPYASLPDATREHYVFEGWYTDWSNGRRVDATTLVSATDTLTLYAHWTRVDQIVTFDPNGGTCDTETQIYTIGGTYSPLPDAFLEHYVLVGWYTSAEGGERVDAARAVTETDTLTLYAHWKRGDQIVTFDPNGGICGAESQVYTIGGAYNPLPSATREQYALAGWYTHWLDGERIFETNVVTADDTRELYAHWIRLEAGSVQVVDSYQTTGTNEITMDFFGYGGKQYALQRSPQLGSDSEWSILDTLHADHADIYTFTNIPPPGWHSGFYRVVEMEEPTQYLVVDMSGGTSAEKWPVSVLADVPEGGWTDEYKTDKLVLRRIPASPPYYMGVFEVTQRQWELARGTRPSYFSNDLCYATRPVECIWHEDICGVAAFEHMRIEWDKYPNDAAGEVDEDSFLGVLQAKTGLPFNIPTGWQWEFACRAGTTTALNSGKELTDDSSCTNMAEVGRYRYNGGVEDVQNNYHWNYWQDGNFEYYDASGVDTSHGTAKVGSYRPNAWGLYDMHGNVGEWCTVVHETWFDTFAPQRGGNCVNPSALCTVPCMDGYECDRYSEATLIAARLETQSEGEGGVVDYGSGFRVYCPAEFPAAMLVDEYMVVDMSGGANAASWPVHPLTSIPEGGWTSAYKTTNLLLRRIVPGTFTMGSPETEAFRSGDETPHEVKLSKPFYMGVFEVTQRQWELAMGTRPSWCHNSDCYAARPVECVDYSDIRGASLGTQWPLTNAVDAKSFFGVLRAKTGLVFDLPTEAQWEYSCRAATTTEFNSAGLGRYGLSSPFSPEYYFSHSDYSVADTSKGTAEVGSFRPNGWGLYDMHGNVGEWCLDWYGDYATSTAIDPVGATSGTSRVIRGGGWYSKAPQCRSADRNDPDLRNYSVGFRACCSTEIQ